MIKNKKITKKSVLVKPRIRDFFFFFTMAFKEGTLPLQREIITCMSHNWVETVVKEQAWLAWNDITSHFSCSLWSSSCWNRSGCGFTSRRSQTTGWTDFCGQGRLHVLHGYTVLWQTRQSGTEAASCWSAFPVVGPSQTAQTHQWKPHGCLFMPDSAEEGLGGGRHQCTHPLPSCTEGSHPPKAFWVWKPAGFDRPVGLQQSEGAGRFHWLVFWDGLGTNHGVTSFVWTRKPQHRAGHCCRRNWKRRASLIHRQETVEAGHPGGDQEWCGRTEAESGEQLESHSTTRRKMGKGFW